MKKIGIVGFGYVGKAMYEFFKDHYEIFIYDPYQKNSNSKSEINQCDISFICVPTPKGDKGQCDVSLVEETLEWLNTELIVIKSTVEVGTTDKLSNLLSKNLVFSPEYIGESTYWSPFKFHTDMKETPFFTFGGNKKECSKVINFYLPVTGPCKRYIISDAKTAEMAKYVENSFYATKVAFCNEIYDICNSLNIDWNEVRELWLADPRLHPMHTAVFSDNRGFGGKCFPKDLNALINTAKKLGVNSDLLEGVLSSNDKVRNDTKKNT